MGGMDRHPLLLLAALSELLPDVQFQVSAVSAQLAISVLLHLPVTAKQGGVIRTCWDCSTKV